MSLFFLDLENNYTERFDMGRFMRYDADNYDPITSDFIRRLKNLKAEGRFTVQGEDGRPDLISHKVYNDTQFWWVILMFNDIFEVESLVTGMQLNYPARESLENLFFKLKSNETAQ